VKDTQLLPSGTPDLGWAGLRAQGGDLLRSLASLAGPFGSSGTPLDDLRRSMSTRSTPSTTSSEEVHADLQRLVG
jgi:hypothetical protein